MSIYVLTFLIGVIAGLRSMTAPAAVCWAARLGLLPLDNTGLSFLRSEAAPYVVSALAILELIADKRPDTPSRKAALGFIVRIVTGGFCGAVLGIVSHAFAAGLIAGALGAVAGTFGGYEFRMRLARAIGKDFPAALIEDAIAIGGAAWILSAF